MVKWNFKSCPRCGGDIFVDRDHNGWHEQCLQCGYRCDMPRAIQVHQYSEEKEKQYLRNLEKGWHGHTETPNRIELI